ncbi:MAG: STAS-like domain-containing protein [Campylobacteraceae bacterium]|jgi:hypothetical protein|nr:STAS-like domain-containing protein [Campylobacteraceae bacterium]
MSNIIEKYNFAEKFTPYPGPRFKEIGEFSGEEFRETVLKQYFDKNMPIELNVDDVLLSFGPSFLSEAFGQIAALYGIEKFQKIIKVKNDTEKGKIFEKKMMEYVLHEIEGKK